MPTFYDYSLRLSRTPSIDAYRIHQQLDNLMRQGMCYALPYCWHHQSSSVAGSSDVLIRSATPLTLPGQKVTQIELEKGMDITFTARVYAAVALPHSNKGTRDATWEETLHRLPKSLPRAGFELLCATLIGSEKYTVTKKGMKRFFIPAQEVAFTVTVQDVALAEQALVYGIGKRKAFGCGLLRDIEVL